jgi:alkaline phosphatase D
MASIKSALNLLHSSVTAPGYESAGLGSLAPYIDGSGVITNTWGTRAGLIDDVNYVDTSRRGYLLMTVTSSSITGQYIFVDNIRSKTYNADSGQNA